MTKTNSFNNAFGLLTSLFFMWGFITVMNDVLINTFKEIFDLTPTQRSLIQMSFFGAFFIISFIYFLISTTTGKDPINRIGYKNGMYISLVICGIGCIAFYPAALLNSYIAFLLALFVLASGVTCLQICANPYATILGDPKSASGRLNLAQGLNSLGTTIGPLIGAILIFKIFSSGVLTPLSVGKTYLIYGTIFIGLALLVKLSKMPAFTNNEKIESKLEIFKHKHLVLGIIAIFFYVGSEVSVGSWIVEFILDKKIMGMGSVEAHYYLSYFWGGLMIGRLVASISFSQNKSGKEKNIYMAFVSIGAFFIIYFATSIKVGDDGSFSLEFLKFRQIYLYIFCLLINYIGFLIGKEKPAQSLVLFCSINFLLFMIVVLMDGIFSFWAIIATGLFFSIGWSNIFALAIRDLGKYTSQGSSLLIMAILGGAIIPNIQSRIIEAYGVQISFIIPALCMLYLIFYGISGYKKTSK